ncbi:RNA-binding protein (KH domain) [Granulicella pectinivorans]|uniref:RNA-binding protein KhpA n=1 Tax=Granulicella pectinivorans TaxID=474950 RepID=A0A1I6LRL1_9BACT|nr:KH domain-containing protein [Granulicella pectinivorans]SFS06084.1 RNA-binding protein (KH domain) [Granulicella pectinivorans]
MKGTILHSLLIGVTRALVDSPELVFVTVTPSERGYNLDIQVASSDIGKVIGKQGRTARAIRSIVGAAAVKLKTTACVNIAALPLR